MCPLLILGQYGRVGEKKILACFPKWREVNPISRHRNSVNQIDFENSLHLAYRSDMVFTQKQIPFVKMNGLGNDFVVVDARSAPFSPDPSDIRRWGDRKGGIGFDQMILIEDSMTADAFMRVYNADGSSVETCGNALRCVALQLKPEGGTLSIDTLGGKTEAMVKNATHITIDMGRPRLKWDEIPLAEDMDTRGFELQIGPIDAPLFHTPSAINMGNPHCIFFVDDVLSVDVAAVGSLLEHHPVFPQSANIEFAQVLDPQTIRMRVWERGAGITKACGTGACAVAVAAARKRLTERRVRVIMDGGSLDIDWRDADDHVLMTGPAVIEFEGYLT